MHDHRPLMKLNSIQALRGIAAWLVMLYHCAGVQKEQLPDARIAERELLTGLWDYGYIGVDLFFIISGLIMVYVTQNTPATREAVGRFLYKRASRIYSLWWVFAFIFMMYFLVRHGQIAPPDRIIGTQEITLYTIRSLLLFPQTYNPIPAVGWTLIHEMYFYIVFAGFLFFARRALPFLLAGWAAVIILAIAVFPVPGKAMGLFSLAVSPLTLEFIAGAFVALAILKELPHRIVMAGLAVAGLVCLFLFIQYDPGRLILKRIVWFAVPFAALIYYLSWREHRDQLTVPDWLVKLGDWSYSLYLSHMLVLLVLRKTFSVVSVWLPGPVRFAAEGPLDNLLFASIAIPATIVTAFLCHRFVELPLLSASRRLMPGRND